MYDISVPIKIAPSARFGFEETLKELEKFNTKRVIIALGFYEVDPQKKAASLQDLKEICDFFHSHGYEVGAWVWTFMLMGKHPFNTMHTIQGTPMASYACPTDEVFSDFVAQYLHDIALTGVDLIQFDDDFRYGFLDPKGPGCLCEKHMAEICKILGEEVTREAICEHILNGGPNKYRDAYLQANGDIFRAFAKKMRAAVESADPSVRLGACACLTSWDIDGIMAMELSRILAGKTKPFIRLIGAPYWAVKRNWGNELQDAIDMDRMEAAWIRAVDPEIEIIAEGDSFPRPRSTCPASYLENFDMAIRAAGCCDGILKYGIDYFSNMDYETGYLKFHLRNQENYAGIHKHFDEKEEAGVRVYTYTKKLSKAVFEKPIKIEHMVFPQAARVLSYNTIPIKFEGKGICGAVFGEDARQLPLEEIGKGMILDLAAAKALTDRGVDVGVASFGDMIKPGRVEHYYNPENYCLTRDIPVCNMTLQEGAEVLSDTETTAGICPVSFRYENEAGQRFLVFNCEISVSNNNTNILRTYARSRQIEEQIQWISGQKLPAYCYGNPAMYTIVKEGNGELAVGLWNLHADIAIDPVVELAEGYSSIEFIGCSGKLEGNKVTLSDIPAFGFAGFNLKK